MSTFIRFMELLVDVAPRMEAPPLDGAVCADQDDEKFIARAMAGGGKVIARGDRHPESVSGYAGIQVLCPRAVVDRYLV
jgi:hypothetical protein